MNNPTLRPELAGTPFDHSNRPYFNLMSDSGRERHDAWEANNRGAQMRYMLNDYATNGFGTEAPTPAPPPMITSPQMNPYLPGGPLYNQAASTGDVTPGSTPNVFDVSGQAFNAGVGGLAHATNPLTPAMSMNAFINPYRQMVLSDALSRQRDDMAMNLNMVQSQAAQQGAFGGARHGLVEAELMDRYNRNAGELAARVMQQGFDTSANLGLQGMAQNRIAAQSLASMAPVGFNLGDQALTGQMRAGSQQQQMLQQILSMAAGGTEAFGAGPTGQLRTALLGAQGNPLAGRSQTTEQFNPGLLQYLQFGAGLMGGK